MKKTIENSIKESLNGHEMPYDPAAWTSLSTRLDHIMPTSPKPSYLKWYLGGAAAVAVIVTGTVLWKTTINHSEKSVAQQTETIDSRNTANSSTGISDNKNENNSNELSTSIPTNNSESTSKSSETTMENEVISGTEQTNSSSNQKSSSQEGIDTPKKSSGNSPIDDQRTPYHSATAKEIQLPEIGNICLGASVTVKNTNDVDLLISGGGTKVLVSAHKTVTFKPESDGKYSVGYTSDNKFHSSPLFTVYAAPKAEITVSDIDDNGLPTLELSTNSNGSSYSWDLGNGTGKYSENEVIAHYFNKGSYTVSLTVTGSNGCSDTETERITITEDYNLMAGNAIETNSSNIERNSFMPDALTVRSVDFTMIIIDPNTGATIFETSDASNRWTGIDKRTGQLVELQKTYIWKVVLKNPVKGEKSEYSGTIIRL